MTNFTDNSIAKSPPFFFHSTPTSIFPQEIPLSVLLSQISGVQVIPMRPLKQLKFIELKPKTMEGDFFSEFFTFKVLRCVLRAYEKPSSSSTLADQLPPGPILFFIAGLNNIKKISYFREV